MLNGPLGDTMGPPSNDLPAATVNLSYFMLKKYYEIYGKFNNNIEWLMADLFVFDDFKTICKDLKQENPNILALSVFIWNETFQFKLAKWCRINLPDTVIVMGGPQLVAHKDTNWFSTRQYIDYVVYGDGEKPFQQLIDYCLGDDNKANWVNIVENLHDAGSIKYPFEQMRDEYYFSQTAIVDQGDFVKEHIDYLVDRGVSKAHMSIGIEFARGCMYKCSFCDWSQNLTKKVTRREYDWKSELLYWKDLDVPTRETDANFGQWDEDREIYDWALERYDPNKNFKFICWNHAKTKVKHTPHFMLNNAIHFGARVKFQLQDVSVDVLQKMDRPSLTWDQYKQMIIDLGSQPEVDPLTMSAAFMVGSPGQTYDTLSNSIVEVWNAGIYNLQLNWWMLLPNSPGAEPAYMDKYNIKSGKIYYVYRHPEIKGHSLSELYEAIDTDYWPIRKAFLESSNAVYQTDTMSMTDINAVHVLYELIKDFKVKNPEYYKIKDFTSTINKLKSDAYQIAEYQNSIRKPFESDYDFVVVGRYHKDEQKLTKWYN